MVEIVDPVEIVDVDVDVDAVVILVVDDEERVEVVEIKVWS